MNAQDSNGSISRREEVEQLEMLRKNVESVCKEDEKACENLAKTAAEHSDGIVDDQALKQAVAALAAASAELRTAAKQGVSWAQTYQNRYANQRKRRREEEKWRWQKADWHKDDWFQKDWAGEKGERLQNEGTASSSWQGEQEKQAESHESLDTGSLRV